MIHFYPLQLDIDLNTSGVRADLIITSKVNNADNSTTGAIRGKQLAPETDTLHDKVPFDLGGTNALTDLETGTTTVVLPYSPGDASSNTSVSITVSKQAVTAYNYEYQLNATKPYRKYKKDYCEACGFVALFPIQLDVDHINGDSTNNDPSNLQTLCANCHRLKTRLNWDFYKSKKEAAP